jgi:signal transduction histidine kinase
MTRDRLWGRSSANLALVFLGVAAPPALTLVWLGLQLLHEDRALLAQRDLERHQAAQAAVVRALEQSVASAERRAIDGPVPEGTVRFVMTAESFDAQPADRVLWLPRSQAMPAAESARFADTERWEYQGGLERALAVYVDAAKSSRVEVRAAALLRIARIHRSRKEWQSALDAYHRLAMITNVAIEHAPADLQARRAIISVLQESGRREELQREATRLETDLLSGRWRLDRPSWQLTARELESLIGRPVPTAPARRLFSDAAQAVVADPSRLGAARRLVPTGTGTVLVLSRQEGASTFVLGVAPDVQQNWATAAGAHAPAGTQLSLLGPSGGPMVGAPAVSGQATTKASVSETGLPWTVAMRFGGASPSAAERASRQRLLAAGLAAILLFFFGGGYFLWRVLQRELAVARLQTDFVSAVSHEFRTPLTSMRHATELLKESDDVPPDRRLTFYEALDRNTERLHRLVESLLDFSRMEAGHKHYDLRPVDIRTLTADVVADFQKAVGTRGFVVDLQVDAGVPVLVRADAPSLTNALWNLLDNAVKYSPDGRAIGVSLQPAPGGVEIAVRDHGLGIPVHERKEILRRFVRGEQAKRLGIKGTGLGLAMVSHILAAHGGRLELDSQEGVGSTFRMVLPAAG